MTLEKRHFIYLLFLVIGSLLLVNPTNLNAEEQSKYLRRSLKIQRMIKMQK